MIAIWLLVTIAITCVSLISLSPRGGEGQGEGRPFLLLRPVDAPTPAEQENLKQPNAGKILTGPVTHHNRKLGHLQNALSTLAPKTLLIVDADVRVDDALINGLLSALDAGAELAWAAPRPEAKGLTRGLLVQSLHSFQSLDAITRGPRPVCGKAIALGPQAIEILRELPDCLGEDLELAGRLHAKNLKVTLAGEANLPGPDASLRTLLARFTRWMQVLKAHRPFLFPSIPLLFAATPLLSLAALWDRSAPILIGTLVLISLRATLAAVLERRAGIFMGWFGAEVLLLCCWVNALLLGSKVTWRGRVLEVGLHGRLSGSGSAE